MKKLEYYLTPIEKRSDFLEYKKTHSDITVEEFVSKGLTSAYVYDYYDIIHIAFDFWETGFYSNKLDLISAVLTFCQGKTNNHIAIALCEKVISNIDYYKGIYQQENNQ